MISHPNLPRIHRPPGVYWTPPSLPSFYLMSTSTERVEIITSCNVPPTKAKMYCSKPKEYGHDSANKHRLQQSPRPSSYLSPTALSFRNRPHHTYYDLTMSLVTRQATKKRGSWKKRCGEVRSPASNYSKRSAASDS
jgi:hypothetical protein